ncbi:ankyrin repeat domain-containing protein [Wolbachia endosymbiont of Carposina sasakii]|uniref:ankyrin repeat domain-containing protein n=1 Tax=unclassified Wolbachia TaxID=2640676 RepID=UPI0003FE2052|nr:MULTISPECIES: ankyrin repeat domain-containing protein [unclassified Wolbachia]PBD15871.1 ankyrin repeat domain-containing protein [Wolbachia endosymbiont of Drosophila subpulchrella]QDH18917.1 ankyrin repeat domain-containing protein [Wolbachia endosymbiont of Carposina sasakii]
MADNLSLELIKCLINQPGLDVNVRGLNGKTPLHCAIEFDELSMVDLLLTKKNINPFVEDNEGKTSLDYAKEGKKAEILQALINNKYGSEQDSLLHLAAMIGEVNAVRYLIRKGIDVNVRNALHHTPLHLAAGIGHAEVVKILIREGKAEIDVFDARNQTPMHYAVNNKKLEIVKLLLKLGADVNSARMGQNSMKLSPVHIAVSNTNYDERDLCLDILKCLIREPNAQVNLQDYENKTPLHYAERLKTIEVLLTREDIDPLVKDDSGKTPFDYAENRPEIKKVLMSSKYGSEKNSLLHLAAQKGVVDTILKEEIDINILNNKGHSPIYLAAEKGHLHVVKLLLKKGANYTPVLHLAIKSNNLELLKTLFKEKSIKLPDEIGRSVPIYYRCIERRDAKVRKYNNVICVSTSVSAVAIAVYIGLTAITISNAIIFATITGIFALIIAIMISEVSKRYIENEFQKKMFMELEECSSTVNDVEIEPVMSRCR